MARQVSNVNILTDTWEIFLLQTNELLGALSNEIVTANSTYGVTGNTAVPRNFELVGQQAANVVIVTDQLRGGNLAGQYATLQVGTNTQISNTTAANIHIGVANSTSFSYMNPVQVSLGNTASNATLSGTTLTVQTSGTVNTVISATQSRIANSTKMSFQTSTGFYAGNTAANASLTDTDLFVYSNATTLTQANGTAFAATNSSGNTLVTADRIRVQTSTSSANMDAIGFRAGIFVGNTTAMAVGANAIVTSSAMQVGNSTANAVQTSAEYTVANTTANASLNPTTLKLGNSSGFATYTANVITTSTPLTITNAVSFWNTLTVNGAVTVANTLTITGNTTFNGNVSIGGTLSLTSPITFTSNTTYSGLATFTANVALQAFTTANNLTTSGNVTFQTTSAVIANNSPGSSGQVLTSNGTSVYWSTVAQAASGITTLNAGNGLSGGGSTSTVNVAVIANSGIIANTTGVFVNASSIAVGTLPYSIIPANIVNTTSSFTFSANQTFSNNITVTQYTETVATGTGTAYTVNLANGSVHRASTTGNITITLPSSVNGKSFTVIVAYGGTHTVTWAGGSTIKWNGGTAPTTTSSVGKIDIFTFFQDGTNTYGTVFGQGF